MSVVQNMSVVQTLTPASPLIRSASGCLMQLPAMELQSALSESRLPISRSAAGSSVRNLVHWAQGLRAPAPTFQKYDWGGWCWGAWMAPKPCNWRAYGRATPPEYHLSKVTVPIGLFSGAPVRAFGADSAS